MLITGQPLFLGLGSSTLFDSFSYRIQTISFDQNEIQLFAYRFSIAIEKKNKKRKPTAHKKGNDIDASKNKSHAIQRKNHAKIAIVDHIMNESFRTLYFQK